MLLFVLLFLFSLFASTQSQAHAADSTQPITQAQLTCLKQQGYFYFISRIYTATGQIDNIGLTNLVTTFTAGMGGSNVYFAPCVVGSCPSPRDQFTSVYNVLRNTTIPNTANITNYVDPSFSIFYIDVTKEFWSTNITYNRDFLYQIVWQAYSTATPAYIGIYTNAQDWTTVFGDWHEFSSLPLWWNVAGNDSLDGYVSFGGWKINTNLLRQHKKNVNICGNTFNLNFMANSKGIGL